MSADQTAEEDRRKLRKSWYHPRLTPQEGEALLQQKGKHGSFLVRPSGHKHHHCTLMVKYSDGQILNKAYHFPIINKGTDEKPLYTLDGQGSNVLAETLYDLLIYFTKNPIKIHQNPQGVLLKYVMNCEDPVIERWFHGFLPPKEAEDLLSKHGKRRSFLVRESFKDRGTYTISVRTTKQSEKCEVHHIHLRQQGGLYRIDGDRGQSHQKPKLADLIDSLRGSPFMLQDGKTRIELRYPLVSKTVTACDLKKRVDLLDKVSPDTQQSGFLEEFMMLQHMTADPELTKNICMLPQNKQQNRFKNILPYDHSLVKLHDGGGKDYINANYIQAHLIDPEIEQTYIATQGPLAHTMVDFWRMVLQENVRVIAMTTKVVERGKNKCSKYWADEVNPNLEFPTETGTIYVTFKDVTDYNVYCVREFEVRQDGVKPVARRPVYQYHFIAWPDFGVPKDPGLMLNYLRELKIKHVEIQKQLAKRRHTIGPLIIHCSAGIGRTGTVIVLDILIQQIVLRGVHCALNIYDVVRGLRQQREGMIQTDPQYKFLYIAMEHYVGTMNQRIPTAPASNGQAGGSEYENIYSNGRTLVQR